MKELSVTRIFICLAVTYSFFPMDTLRLYAPFLVSNNLINLNNWFLKLSQQLDRNLSQDPENLMTTVNFKNVCLKFVPVYLVTKFRINYECIIARNYCPPRLSSGNPLRNHQRWIYLRATPDTTRTKRSAK